MFTKIASSVSIMSYPKVNLALDILGKDASGYHVIKTVFHRIDEPCDEIRIESSEKGEVSVACDNPKVPLDDTNTVMKAAKLLKRYFNIEQGAKIFIKKQIPLMSGLGGGASNAVAALKGLAQVWGLPQRNDVLRRIADQIGMDCAFFFDGGTALGEHFGEKIITLPALPGEIKFEIIETGIEISSHWAYRQIDLQRCAKSLDKTKKLIAATRAGNNKGILKNIHNDFEEFVFAAHPELREIKKREFQKNPQSKIILCGSGGALFRATLW